MIRPRRLRRSHRIRDLVSETDLRLRNLIQPVFLSEDPKAKEPIEGFLDVYRYGVESVVPKIESYRERGIGQFLLFGYAREKDEKASKAFDPSSSVALALANLKQRFGSDITLYADVCLCPYQSSGHCGVLENGKIVNDASLPLLAAQAKLYAEMGADFVAPSDMMDGRIGFIRRELDDSRFEDTGILAYSAKYASSYYGPFRSALDSTPQGDRATYQMDFRNSKEALRELKLDEKEGADIVMVKPALPYLDIIHAFSQNTRLPIAAYNVSGEYMMAKKLIESGLADERKLILENLFSIKRAGASMVITYHAELVSEKRWLDP